MGVGLTNGVRNCLVLLLKLFYKKLLLWPLQQAAISTSEMVHCLTTTYVSLSYFISFKFEKQYGLEF